MEKNQNVRTKSAFMHFYIFTNIIYVYIFIF